MHKKKAKTKYGIANYKVWLNFRSRTVSDMIRFFKRSDFIQMSTLIKQRYQIRAFSSLSIYTTISRSRLFAFQKFLSNKFQTVDKNTNKLHSKLLLVYSSSSAAPNPPTGSYVGCVKSRRQKARTP